MAAHRLFTACLFLLLSPWAAAAEPSIEAPDLVVVANPSSGVDKLNRGEVVNIFLGRQRQLPSGVPVIPLDLPASSPEKASFYAMLVGKDLAEINAYWARLIFSGRTQPPRQTQSMDEMMSMVRDNRGALGYVGRPKADPRVKVVFDLNK